MDNNYYIYIYKDPKSNQPFYVGKGKNNRAYQNYTSSRNMWVYNKINKIIENGSTMEDIVSIIENNLSEEDAFNKEIYYISKYGKIKDGLGILFNMTDGGDMPPNRRGSRYKMDDIQKKNISKSWTNERKKKMSDRLKDKKRNKKWGENISSGKRNKTKFEKNIFEKHVKNGLKLKDIWEAMDISYDIIRDRMLLYYKTKDFKQIRKILNVGDDIKIRQHQIDFDILKKLTLEGTYAKDIIKHFNIKCIKTLTRFINYKYNINSFEEYKKFILTESD